MDDSTNCYSDLVHLARLALAARPQDVQAFLARLAKRYQLEAPEASSALIGLLRETPTRANPLRKQTPAPVPVDTETKLQLMRVEPTPELSVEPIWSEEIRGVLGQLTAERRRASDLLQIGLSPTRSAIFTGEPGVGKTLAARWLARELNKPLLTLDLSAVMNSFLGRTGTNIRYVIDYAKYIDGILLLDEIDSIAKRRDDAGDVGELKRLVTVLLQEIDDWPSTSLLIAATNHPQLLDPAVWRRFDAHLQFPLPSELNTRHAIERFLGTNHTSSGWLNLVTTCLSGLSYSDIEREITRARRIVAVQDIPIEAALLRIIISRVGKLGRAERVTLALGLSEVGLSQRRIHELTGVSRDTLRKHLAAEGRNKHRDEADL